MTFGLWTTPSGRSFPAYLSPDVEGVRLLIHPNGYVRSVVVGRAAGFPTYRPILKPDTGTRGENPHARATRHANAWRRL